MTSDAFNISVRDAYKRGLIERGQRSFCAGSTYKIREYRQKLQRYKSILESIGQAYSAQEMPFSFGPCAGSEAEDWCNSCLYFAAYGLGHDFEGALDALTKDGISQHLVDSLKKNVNREIRKVLKVGMQARVELRNSWSNFAPKLGKKSRLDDFIDRTIHLIEKTLLSAATDLDRSHDC